MGWPGPLGAVSQWGKNNINHTSPQIDDVVFSSCLLLHLLIEIFWPFSTGQYPLHGAVAVKQIFEKLKLQNYRQLTFFVPLKQMQLHKGRDHLKFMLKKGDCSIRSSHTDTSGNKSGTSSTEDDVFPKLGDVTSLPSCNSHWPHAVFLLAEFYIYQTISTPYTDIQSESHKHTACTNLTYRGGPRSSEFYAS